MRSDARNDSSWSAPKRTVDLTMGVSPYLVGTDDLLDLTQLYIDYSLEARFPPQLVAQNTIGGRRYGIPDKYVPWGIWFRKSVFAALGLSRPQTWTQFLAVCEAIRVSQLVTYALTFNSADFWGGLSWTTENLLRLGGAYVYEQRAGEIALDTHPIVREAYQKVDDLFALGYFPPKALTATVTFVSELIDVTLGPGATAYGGDADCAMILSSPVGEIAPLLLGLPESDYGYFPYPTMETAYKRRSSNVSNAARSNPSASGLRLRGRNAVTAQTPIKKMTFTFPGPSRSTRRRGRFSDTSRRWTVDMHGRRAPKNGKSHGKSHGYRRASASRSWEWVEREDQRRRRQLAARSEQPRPPHVELRKYRGEQKTARVGQTTEAVGDADIGAEPSSAARREPLDERLLGAAARGCDDGLRRQVAAKRDERRRTIGECDKEQSLGRQTDERQATHAKPPSGPRRQAAQ